MDHSHLVKRLRGDRWEAIEVRSLKPNDIFLHANGARVVTAKPIILNGQLRVPAKDYVSGAILTTGEYQIDHCKDCNYNAAEQHKGSCIVGV